ncbi:TIGR04222 domain-containing membrane protein [Streptomyces sp. SJL17-1]|uniref:TIGR04222 domain-containing membrane protein n=1 Tax=Streptomyces sp. SJL17-1 TaxID=2967223 RepID=UPI00296651EA|nr:TIGR04222 domain-containing membrane protein [Streptomyces sp. SJL17-1]
MAETGNGDEVVLDVYEYAYLAGGKDRVVESAIISLTERGMLSLRAGRLRTVGEERPQHAIELAVITACPRSKRVQDVFEALRQARELDELARRLVSLGLLRNWRRRITRAGRRRLATAASDGDLPTHVLEGSAALGSVRYGSLSAHAGAPSGLGRTLLRMGKALEDDRGHPADRGSDGDGGFGGGGGGGD